MARIKKQKAKKYTPSEIVSLYDTKRKSVSFQALLEQMEGDFDLISLVPYEAEAGHLSYTTPKPKNDFGKILSGVNKSGLTWQIVTPEDAPQTERDKASKGEELITGIIDRADRSLRAIGEPPLRAGLAWYGCGRGIGALKCLIYTNDEREMTTDIRPLDPMHMAWEKGVDGLVWAAFEYHVSAAEALDRWGIEIEDNEDARVIDFFDKKINAVVFSHGGKKEPSSEFVKEPASHGLDHVPMWIGFAGGMPTVYTKENDATLKYRAGSVFAASRGLYEPFNKQVSFIMDIAE